uniref:L1 transposable element RRM domain-containing protein n=1 Tax=Panthera leo TaxID=9689 RepID=A0A8C8WU41_PANLE
MTKRRNSPQKKEHEETTAKDLTNRDTSKRSEPEFRITIIRILAGVENRLDSLSAEIKEVKNSQNEIKDAITELQSRMDAAAARMDEVEHRISDRADKLIENNQAEKKREMKAKEDNLTIREISDSLKRNNIRIIGVPEEEEREIGVEGLCEQIIAGNFPNLGKDTDIKTQEAQRTLIRFNKNQPSTWHIIVKFTKCSGKERIMKAAREEKSLTYKGRQIRFAEDLSTETWQARKEWEDIFNVQKQKSMQPRRMLYPARLSFKIEGEIKSFPDRGAWVAQLVKCSTSAQVMISWSVSPSPASGSVLTARSLEPGSDSVSPSLSAPPPLMLCLSLC